MKTQFLSKKALPAYLLIFSLLFMVFSCSTPCHDHRGDTDMGDDDSKSITIECDSIISPFAKTASLEFNGEYIYSGCESFNAKTQNGCQPIIIYPVVLLDNNDISTSSKVDISYSYQSPSNTSLTPVVESAFNAVNASGCTSTTLSSPNPLGCDINREGISIKPTNVKETSPNVFKAGFKITIKVTGLTSDEHEIRIRFHYPLAGLEYGHDHYDPNQWCQQSRDYVFCKPSIIDVRPVNEVLPIVFDGIELPNPPNPVDWPKYYIEKVNDHFIVIPYDEEDSKPDGQ